MSSSTQIKFGAMLSYICIGINIIAGLLYTPWMVSKLGQSQYGLYTLANSLITIFLIDFGLSATTARYLSKYNAEGKHDEAESFLGAVYKLYLLIDLLIVLVLGALFFFIDKMYVNFSSSELEQFKVVYLIAAIFNVINFPFVSFNGILTSYEKFIFLKITDIVYRIFNVSFAVIALACGYGLYALVILYMLLLHCVYL